MNYDTLVALSNLDAAVRRKLDRKRKEPYLSGKRLGGYKEAMLAVLSMIHSEKERLK